MLNSFKINSSNHEQGTRVTQKETLKKQPQWPWLQQLRKEKIEVTSDYPRQKPQDPFQAVALRHRFSCHSTP